MTQFVRVLYPRSRSVEIDNTISGLTNQVLLVEEGTHRFDLGQPLNYTPSFIDKVVTGTNPAKPMELAFTPLTALATPARIPVKAAAAPARKKKRARRKPARATR